ncbi:MAG: Soluble aldose sugar dehydrogenase YliI precursor [Planctomycetota bacterium]
MLLRALGTLPHCLIALLLTTTTTAAQTTPNNQPPKSRIPWTSSALHGTPLPPDPWQVVPAFPHLRFDHPTSLQELPNSNQLLVTEISGRILLFDRRTNSSPHEIIHLAHSANGPVSLFSAVPHPRFNENRFLYVCYVSPSGGNHTRVSRFTLPTADSSRIDPASETVIITWPAGGHNAGCLRFGPDGLLYIATGDGSGPNPPDGLTTGQSVNDLLGAILRIDVDKPRPAEQIAYSIPTGNPFPADPATRPEIFGYGLRNPWKFGIDQQTGEVFVADNGWETWEMIHLVASGTNCGWPIMEGRARLRSEVQPGPTPITPPIRDHHHSEANSVIGGPVYRGSKLPTLNGQFVYGDYITGTLWSVGRDPSGSFVGHTLCDTDLRIIDFLAASTGELFVLDYDLTGGIYELQPNATPDLSAGFPRLLSRTGLFQSLSPLTPAPGVVEYDVVVPRWTDGAQARRFAAVPGDAQIQLAATHGAPASYPQGTVFAKHLVIPASADQPEQPLETQILQYDHGVWHPYAYRWNAAGSDAELVSPTGTAAPVMWPNPHQPGTLTERTWHTSALNECRLCHNAGPGFVLGFVGNQLNRNISTPAGHSNQLELLHQLKLIDRVPEEASTAAHTLVNPRETSASIEDRARSWLHGNCSMCHHRGGNAIVSFFVTRDLPFEQMNTNKGTNIGTFGMQNAKVIAAGDPWRSVMMYRLSRLGYARMPYIGSRVVDSDGVALIAEWIAQLKPDTEHPLSSPLQTDSPDARALALLSASGTSPAERSAAVQQLVSSTPGALALAVRLHTHQNIQSPAETQTAAVEAVRNAPSDIRGLFDDFLPESLRKQTLGSNFSPDLVLRQTGDPLRGRLIFYSDAARCRTCHQLDDAANSVGPTLADVSRKHPRTEDLLLHVMQPSLKIDERYAAWTAVTTAGQVHNGLLVSESPEQVVLRQADARSVTLKRQDLDEFQRSSRSLMPDGVLADLTAAEAADLLAFIRSLNPQ